MRSWYKYMYRQLEYVRRHDAYTIALHCCRGDATNANTWQKLKLHSTEVTSVFVTTDLHWSTAWDEAKASCEGTFVL